jgi:hypothetical protein
MTMVKGGKCAIQNLVLANKELEFINVQTNTFSQRWEIKGFC